MRWLHISSKDEVERVSPGGRLGRVWRLMPVALFVVLVPLGWILYLTVENGLKKQVENQLQTVLQADVAAGRLWISDKRTAAQLIAAQDAVVVPAQQLVQEASRPDVNAAKTGAEAAREQLGDAITPLVQGTGAVGYAVIDRDGVVVAGDEPSLVGEIVLGEGSGFLDGVLRGETLISHPFMSMVPLPDGENGDTERPTMFVGAPLRAAGGDAFGVLALRLLTEDFTEILTVARWGISGETYAFDNEGRLLSRSRFEGQLKEHGLLPDEPGATSILTVRVVDPGYNILEDTPPRNLSPDRPLTRMAASAVTGSEGVDAEGYRDYRGVTVVGAWTWLPDFEFGVATEANTAEAYESLAVVRWIVFALLGLVAAAAIAVLLFSRSLYFLRIREPADEEQIDRLGQYQLEEKLGEGGLGEVYKASHVLLRRPTAIKLLHPERINDEELMRFQREVQLTSSLTSPHTIRIYDYGISPDGVFYYAMEYLPGADLERLVDRTGPLTEGRVIYLLLQACSSLEEAHGRGIVHRDIKPGNLIVSPHGCNLDFVVVTDFGLAKDLWGKELTNVTNPRYAVGTPRYLAPEALRHDSPLDARGDIYSLGVTAYYLLTGAEPLDADTVLAIVQSVLLDVPEPPSERLGRPVSDDLEQIVMGCLEKDPDARPQSVTVLSKALRSCAAYGTWTEADARAWWAEYGTQLEAPGGAGSVHALPVELLRSADRSGSPHA